jgi:hypothetical protein
VYLCRGDWFARITATASSSSGLSIVGRHGSADTTLSAGSSGGTLITVGASTSGPVTVQGLTLTGGTGTGSPTSYGGAVYTTTTVAPAFNSVVIDDCIITGNTATYGGGVAVIGQAKGLVTNTLIDDNTAMYGGGIAVRSAAVVNVTDSLISNNVASTTGGGAYAESTNSWTTAQLTLTRTEVDSNTATTANGGGVAADNTTYVRLVDSMIARNLAAYGGGVWLDESRVDCEGDADTGSDPDDSVLGIFENEATTHGGGVHLNRVGSSSSVQFNATNCDLGSDGPDDPENFVGADVDDVTVQTGGSSFTSYDAYGVDTDAACTRTGCVP